MTQMTMNEAALRMENLAKKGLDEIILSIDLETPNTHGAGIFSIGIVPFSVETGEIFHEHSFYGKADFASVINQATKTNSDIGGTMKWWMEQKDAARHEVIGLVGHNERGKPVFHKYPSQEELMAEVVAYLHALSGALAVNGRLRPLGNSDLFDVGILEETMRSCGIKIDSLPYKFWDTLDLRTAVYLASMAGGVNVKKRRPREGTHHNALDDAGMQAQWFIDSYQALYKEPTKKA